MGCWPIRPSRPCRDGRQDSAVSRMLPRSPGGFEISFYPDPYIYDGRFANNGWLQEMPRPMTKLTWDNAAIMSIRDGQTTEAVERRSRRAEAQRQNGVGLRVGPAGTAG